MQFGLIIPELNDIEMLWIIRGRVDLRQMPVVMSEWLNKEKELLPVMQSWNIYTKPVVFVESVKNA